MPEGWAWCRLPEICVIPITDGTHQTPTYSDKENGVPFLSSKDVTSGKIDWSKIKYITKELHQELQKRIAPQKNDILLAKNGTTGVAAIVEDETIFDIYVTLAVIRPNQKIVYPEFLLNIINSPFCKNQFNEHLTGIGVPNLHLVDINKTFIPLPPLNEQKQITDKIGSYTIHIDELEKNKSDLQTAIKQAKSKILDLAIHGKLVPQNPNDESAEELLKRIATSDNRPYKKFDDKVPFEIPDSWAWCTGNDLFNPMTSKKPEGETFRYIDIDAIDNQKHYVIEPKTLAVSEAPSRASRELNNGDVLFSLVRPYLENIALIEEEYYDCIASTGFYVCKPRSFVFPKFLFYLMTSEYVIKGLNQFMKGDNSPSISGDDIKNWLYPLPPINEQTRIVLKIEELFKYTDIITISIKDC